MIQTPGFLRAPCPPPFAAAALLAVGTGYRIDIGLFWTPVLLVILRRHRWPVAVAALGLLGALDLAWFQAMLREAGGWTAYRPASGRVVLRNSSPA